MWRLPSKESSAERVLTGIGQKTWTVFDRGICFVSRAEEGPMQLSFYNFSTRGSQTFADLPEGVGVDGSPGLSVSPDGTQILIGLFESGSRDIMLVEDFR